MSATPKLVVRADNAQARRFIAVTLVIAWLITLALAWWLGARQAAPDLVATRERAEGSSRSASASSASLEAARRRIAVLERSDQVSRLANDSLQKTLRVREGDLAALRDDVAFYQRLVGGESGRGLKLQRLAVRPIGKSDAYGFRVLLTRNAQAGETSRGELTLRITGAGRGKLVELPWDRLQQETGATPLGYDFKYFQQLDSSLILPAGFEPDRVFVRARATDGTTVEESFAWQEALATGGSSDVWQ